MIKSFEEKFQELEKECAKIKPYYDIDKIRHFSVYIWTKGEEGSNVFDILADRIALYDKDHIICDEAKEIIKSIQKKLKALEKIW